MMERWSIDLATGHVDTGFSDLQLICGPRMPVETLLFCYLSKFKLPFEVKDCSLMRCAPPDDKWKRIVHADWVDKTIHDVGIENGDRVFVFWPADRRETWWVLMQWKDGEKELMGLFLQCLSTSLAQSLDTREANKSLGLPKGPIRITKNGVEMTLERGKTLEQLGIENGDVLEVVVVK